MRWVLLALALIVGAVQSQDKPIPPVTGQAKAGDKKNKPPAPKQEVTVNLPSSLNVNFGGKLDVVSQNQQARANEEPSKWLDPVTWFTLALVIANIFLWLATKDIAGEAKAASSIAKTAADAAKKSADVAEQVMRNTQRPFVFISTISPSANFQGDEEVTRGFTVSAKAENTGPTPAISCQLWTKIAIGEPEKVMWFAVSAEDECPATTIGPSRSSSGAMRFIPLDYLMRAFRKETAIYFWARINYADMFNTGITYHTELCAELEFLVDPTTLRWDRKTRLPDFATFKVVGPQNSAS